MANRMNYGKRFGTNYVGGPVGYTPTEQVKWGYLRSKKNGVELAMMAGKAQASTKQSKARVGKLPNGDPPAPKARPRLDYETEFGGIITEAVKMLELGLEELNKAPPLANSKEPLLINRRQVIEAIRDLKTSFHLIGMGRGAGSGGRMYKGGKYR